MQNSILVSLTRLSDAQLLSQLKSLVARERDVTAEIVAHLAELETRDVYLREGYPSLFVYCRDVLAPSHSRESSAGPSGGPRQEKGRDRGDGGSALAQGRRPVLRAAPSEP